MKTKIIDNLNNRIIVKNHEKHALTITGDYSSSTITTYWVVNKFNMREPIVGSITLESAEGFCNSKNKEFKTDTFIVIKRTIFI